MSEAKPIITEEQATAILRAIGDAFRPLVERDGLRPWSYREPENGVTLHVNSQGSDGIAFVAVPKRETSEPYEQYGVVVPRDHARDLARAILAELGES